MKYSSTQLALRLSTVLLASITFATCSKGDASGDGDGGEEYGRLRVELTDAASDDPDVSTVYITLAGAAIDGEELEQIGVRQTVDISNFTGGSTIQLGADQLMQTGRYRDLSLTLDLSNDAPGNGPGCYVERADGRIDALGSGAGKIELRLPVDFEITAGGQTRLIADVDLRKAIVREANTEDYAFVSGPDLASSVRVVDAAATGGIEGQIASGDNTAGTVRVVYAYPQGSVDLAAARMGDFSDAMVSARVSNAGNFKLAFLPAGSYELVAAEYRDRDGDGSLEFAGTRNSDAVIGAATRIVLVSVGAQVAVNLQLGTFLP